jgi:hypothetical protein
LQRCQQLRLDVASMQRPRGKPCADLKPYPWCQPLARRRGCSVNASGIPERCPRTCGLCSLTHAQREWEAVHDRAYRTCNAVVRGARSCDKWFVDAGANVS